MADLAQTALRDEIGRTPALAFVAGAVLSLLLFIPMTMALFASNPLTDGLSYEGVIHAVATVVALSALAVISRFGFNPKTLRLHFFPGELKKFPGQTPIKKVPTFWKTISVMSVMLATLFTLLLVATAAPLLFGDFFVAYFG